MSIGQGSNGLLIVDIELTRRNQGLPEKKVKNIAQYNCHIGLEKLPKSVVVNFKFIFKLKIHPASAGNRLGMVTHVARQQKISDDSERLKRKKRHTNFVNYLK